jgi:hypothetical protein
MGLLKGPFRVFQRGYHDTTVDWCLSSSAPFRSSIGYITIHVWTDGYPPIPPKVPFPIFQRVHHKIWLNCWLFPSAPVRSSRVGITNTVALVALLLLALSDLPEGVGYHILQVEQRLFSKAPFRSSRGGITKHDWTDGYSPRAPFRSSRGVIN